MISRKMAFLMKVMALQVRRYKWHCLKVLLSVLPLDHVASLSLIPPFPQESIQFNCCLVYLPWEKVTEVPEKTH